MAALGGASGAAGGAAGAGGAPILAAHATISPAGTGTIVGSASFMRQPGGVTLLVALTNCPSGMHGLHIHSGTTCADPGPIWPVRGANIGSGTGFISCFTNGAGMLGALDYTRPNNPAAARWTIDDGLDSDVVGRVIVVDSVPGNTAAGCGVIQAN